MNQTSVDCLNDGVLQILEGDSGGEISYVRYKLTCCSADGLSSSIIASGYGLRTFAPFEGIYCPVRRGRSGRVFMSMAQQFGDAGLVDATEHWLQAEQSNSRTDRR